MTGTIRERSPGTWLLRWYDYESQDGPDGRPLRVRVQRYKTCKGTKKQAKEALALVTAAKVEGKYSAPNKVTLGDCADRWLAYVEGKGRRTKTLDRYRGIIARQIRPKLGALPVQQVTSAMLDRFYQDLAKTGRDDGKGLSARTIQHVHRVMHGILKRAQKDTLVANNAALNAERPTVEKKKVAAFSDQERRVILDAFKGRPLYTLVALAFDTGLRRGELCALKWSDIDLSAGTLRVDESLSQTSEGRKFEKPKTAAGFRTITLTPPCVADLAAHRKAQLEQRMALGLGKLPDDALVFPGDDGKPRNPDAVTRAFTRVVSKLAVRKLSLHWTRHTCASRLLRAKFDPVTVADRLGHRDAGVTMSVYAHIIEEVDEETKKAQAEALAKALAR